MLPSGGLEHLVEIMAKEVNQVQCHGRREPFIIYICTSECSRSILFLVSLQLVTRCKYMYDILIIMMELCLVFQILAEIKTRVLGAMG